jgi:MFS family permease
LTQRIDELDLESNALILSFIASFGLVKSILNLFAGNISHKLGRKNVLVLWWLVGIPIPFILLFAPSQNWFYLLMYYSGETRIDLVNDSQYEN